jgi:hypothetical protein
VRVNEAANILQRNWDILVRSIVNAHKGILQPQIVSKPCDEHFNTEHPFLSKGYNRTIPTERELDKSDL